MAGRREILVVGNWKMNGLAATGKALAQDIRSHVEKKIAAKVVICPPSPLLNLIGPLLKGSAIGLGAQDCHMEQSGAFTGDVSAEILKDAGCGYVIVGHSERRLGHGESSYVVCQKAQAALAQGIIPILCVGETEKERESGKQKQAVASQLMASLPDDVSAKDFVLAYEPVWAIGTGKVATIEDIKIMHGYIKSLLADIRGWQPEQIRTIYGGSVKQEGARDILLCPAVDGVLVGGASLKAQEFCAIIDAAS